MIGRVVHYKRLPMLGLVIAIATLLVMGWNAQSLTPWSVAGLLAVLGVGFGPVPPVAMVSLQNTVEAHHLGTAVGTLSFLRNLCATIIVAIFGAMVLVGSARVLPARRRRPRPSRRAVHARVLCRRGEPRRFARSRCC